MDSHPFTTASPRAQISLTVFFRTSLSFAEPQEWPCPRYLTPAQRRLSRTRGRMLRAPVPGDLAARGEPHAPAALGVLEEAGEPARPARAARDPAVQSHRHHARLGRALLPELVEGVAEIGGEVVRHLERAAPEADVVGVERVGNDEPGT